MSGLHTLSNASNLGRILDDNNCPVARLRLFSQGIQANNRIYAYKTITGDKGCLACGNCIDACPVIREKKRFLFIQNQRTSMALENIVGHECRRCYACIRACPQVAKPVKEFSFGFRRAEKFIHAYTATLIFFLAVTGIFFFHFGMIVPGWQRLIVKGIHVFLGLFLLVSPLLYFLLDRPHFLRALKFSFQFSREDLYWLKEFWHFIKSPQHKSLPCWKEFNTYHKFWFVYLIVVVPVFGLTGIINLMGESVVGQFWSTFSESIHTIFAMVTDALILLHLYFKVLRHIFRDMREMGIFYKKERSLHYPFSYDSKFMKKS